MATYLLVGWYDKSGYKIVNNSLHPHETVEEKSFPPNTPLEAIKQECEERGRDWAKSVDGIFSLVERKSTV